MSVVTHPFAADVRAWVRSQPAYTLLEPSVLSNLTFWPDRWHADSCMALLGKRILIPLVWAKESGRGSFRELVAAIEANGLRTAIVAPIGDMVKILKHWGFIPHREFFGGDITDVWERAS